MLSIYLIFGDQFSELELWQSMFNHHALLTMNKINDDLMLFPLNHEAWTWCVNE